tara:strand:- start:80 stop:565 length:486 start_codon:yes stop_codon:yes gene_type:complete
MLEVQARIQFTTHCLGNVRNKKIDCFLKDPSEGRVMFLPTWWRALMSYSAKVLNKHHKLAKEVDWDPIVDGTPSEYKRFYKPEVFQLHEAFFPGDIIGVNAVLPTKLTVTDFWQLLDVAGRYKGISPYRPEPKYGTFNVQDVRKRVRTQESEESNIETTNK